MTLKEFKDKWFKTFAKDIPEKDIRKYVVSTGNYIWHIFSCELIPEGRFLEGDEARKAYDSLCGYERETAVYIEPFEEEDTFSLSRGEATSAKLDNRVEIYALSKDFLWTYIKTHENDLCGPYFYSIDPKS